MNAQDKAAIATKVVKVFIDKESVVNKTNVSTGAGVVLMGLASTLATFPEPNVQIAAAVLGAAGFIVSLIHRPIN